MRSERGWGEDEEGEDGTGGEGCERIGRGVGGVWAGNVGKRRVHYRQTILWRKAMQAAREVYGLTPRLPREETYGMRAQITRAADSIPANVAEGWTRETAKDKAHFLPIAQGSLTETESLLTLC